MTKDEQNRAEQSNTHTDFYGDFGIAFSKSWGESNGFQPVQYINPNSKYIESFKTTFHKIAEADDILDDVVDDIFTRLAFIKPVRGTMERLFIKDDSNSTKISFYKNFHDEQEWRYVPDIKKLEMLKLGMIIANPRIVNAKLDDIDNIIHTNNYIGSDQYKNLWLNYSYDDIRYLIVPNSNSRLELIKIIVSIDITLADDTEKYILISKILVLDEIRRDW